LLIYLMEGNIYIGFWAIAPARSTSPEKFVCVCARACAGGGRWMY
jgi:hypothetical protein